jgi:Glycosyl hydrolase family 9
VGGWPKQLFVKRAALIVNKCSLQVGEVEADHKVCLRAEVDTTTPRTLCIVDREHPGADAFAMASVALSAASIALSYSSSGAILEETRWRTPRRCTAWHRR